MTKEEILTKEEPRDKEIILFLNEWSTDWGASGLGYFTTDYLSRVTYIGTCFDLVEKAQYVFKRTLKKGMRGDDVTLLQKYLRERGYFPATQALTGYFGDITKSAVIAFQKAHNLVQDGIAGQKTFAQIK